MFAKPVRLKQSKAGPASARTAGLVSHELRIDACREISTSIQEQAYITCQQLHVHDGMSSPNDSNHIEVPPLRPMRRAGLERII